MAATFENLFQIGQQSEKLVSYFLKQKGYFLLETADFSEKGEMAPHIENQLEHLIIPDLLAFSKTDGQFWAEVKYRSTTWKNHEAKTEQMLLECRLFYQYAKVQEVTHIPVYLFYHIGDEQMIYHQELNQLKKNMNIVQIQKKCFSFEKTNFEIFQKL